MAIGPLEIVSLKVRHGNNEDWYLELPVTLEEGQTLDGVTAKCVLKKGPSTIVFQGDACRVEDSAIIMDLQSESFRGKLGTYTGDILVKFPGDYDIRTHIISAEITDGVTQW